MMKPEQIAVVVPTWKNYELIDSGNFEKLERFGAYVLARPEPQAFWNPSLSRQEWEERADASFRRDGKGKPGDERGEWICRPGMPSHWWVDYPSGGLGLKMRLGLTAFKHVGLFPEQADNWLFIRKQTERIAGLSAEAPHVLNLFAYTGGATLAACRAGAEVTHVDSVKQVVTWARGNMEASGLDGVRWLVDDALKFARREARRGNRYHGIILDPPAYGRGPDGEKWILEEHLNELLVLCGELLEPARSFLVLNLYSMGLSPLLARTAVRQLAGGASGEEMLELCFRDDFGKALPLGVCYRLWRD